MSCKKTGCHIWLPQYDMWVYGDLYSFGTDPVWMIRVIAKSFSPLRDASHGTLATIDEWWDKDSTKLYSTLVGHDLIDYSYEGKTL